MFKLKVLSQVVAAAVASSFLVGCGGGSSSGTAASTTTNVSGSAFASYVSGAQVEVQDVNGNRIAGPVSTNASGRFTVPVPNANLAGKLVFMATGGTYTDEATGEQTTSGELSVLAEANALTGAPSVHATPSSSILNKLMTKHGLSKAEAEAAFTAAFGYLPDSAVAPVDATQENADASEDAKRAGVRAAAFSQLLKNLNLDKGDHSALLEALAEDLVDGTIDGMNGAAAVQLKGGAVRPDMASQFAMALMDFANDATKNKSGLNPGQVGLIKFNGKAVSENYTFELTPPMMTEVGKAEYKLKVTNNTDGSAVANEPVMMMPMMYMAAGHKHSTPHSGCTDTNAEGIATCTAYFLMASAMGNGDVMGNWDLKFTHDSESVHFFPKVMMAMGDDTSRLRLEGDAADADHVQDMMGNDAGRKYFIYKDSVMGTTGDHVVKFFVATQDSMMSFPAVDGTLGGETVELSIDGVVATPMGSGVWKATNNITTLTNDQQGSVALKLSVGGVFKTLDEGDNDQNLDESTFKLTPKTM